eukprot:gene31936-8933_t
MAQAAGASAVIVYDNTYEGLVIMAKPISLYEGLVNVPKPVLSTRAYAVHDNAYEGLVIVPASAKSRA